MPKVVWLYTNPSKMLEDLLINYIIRKTTESGFEVRTVNSRSAYDYLSDATTSMITKVMQNKIIE